MVMAGWLSKTKHPLLFPEFIFLQMKAERHFVQYPLHQCLYMEKKSKKKLALAVFNRLNGEVRTMMKADTKEHLKREQRGEKKTQLRGG